MTTEEFNQTIANLLDQPWSANTARDLRAIATEHLNQPENLHDGIESVSVSVVADMKEETPPPFDVSVEFHREAIRREPINGYLAFLPSNHLSVKLRIFPRVEIDAA